MLFRSLDRGAGSERHRLDKAAVEAERTFGRPPHRVTADRRVRVEVEGMTFLYDPSHDPSFVLAPECNACGSDELHLFPLEEWVMFGAPVRAQARATCRNCRFVSIGSEGPRMVAPHLP